MCEVALDVAWYAQSQSTTNNNNHRLNVDRTFNFRPGKSSKLRSDRYDEKEGTTRNKDNGIGMQRCALLNLAKLIASERKRNIACGRQLVIKSPAMHNALNPASQLATSTNIPGGPSKKAAIDH